MMDCYREMRLRKADELVCQTGLSMLDIALVTGFASAAHFSRLYAKRFGQPPVRRRLALRGQLAAQSGQMPGEVGPPSSNRAR